MRTSMPGQEPAGNPTKTEASILAFAQKRANNLISSAVRDGLITAGQGARLSDAVNAASIKTLSGVYLDVLAEIGVPRPEPAEPEPEPEPQEEPDPIPESDAGTGMDCS